MALVNETRFTFFCPDARVLDEAEIAAIPAEKREAAQADNRKGIWLEFHCPDGSCVGDDGRITIPAVGAESAEAKGFWLNLFCPEGSCELNLPSSLP